MLMEYAKSQHFPNPTFFIDDGYSGVDFSNRPGFQKMLAEIEAGHVEVVITKDLSRLGRNSSLTGLYINYTFPQYGVRYIAINDHFDTIDPNSTDSDMAGIKNWFNEWYSKDTSRKIRAVNKAKGERGERLTTNVPYGYKRDSDDPKKWVIDEEAAQIVKRIFALCMEGKGPSQIAALLEKELCVYDLTQALGLINEIFPLLTTDMSNAEMIGYVTDLLPMLAKAELTSVHIPGDEDYYNATIRGMMVLVPDLDACREVLAEALQ